MLIKRLILIIVLGTFFLKGYGVSMVQNEEITDLYTYESIVYYSTDRGKIFRYNSKDKTKKLVYQFPKVHDFMGDEIDAEVFKVVSKNYSVFALVHSEGGYTDLYEIRKGKAILHLKGANMHAMMNNLELWGQHLYIGLISSELIKYNWQKRQEDYRLNVGSYALSSMSYIKDGRWLFLGDEAGKIYQIDILKAKIKTVFSSQHVDNVLAVSFGGNMVFGGGKDRRLSFYPLDMGTAVHIQLNHFVYILSANKKGNLLAYYDNLNHKIVVMDANLKVIKTKIDVTNEAVQCIIFLDDETLIWASTSIHKKKIN